MREIPKFSALYICIAVLVASHAAAIEPPDKNNERDDVRAVMNRSIQAAREAPQALPADNGVEGDVLDLELDDDEPTSNARQPASRESQLAAAREKLQHCRAELVKVNHQRQSLESVIARLSSEIEHEERARLLRNPTKSITDMPRSRRSQNLREASRFLEAAGEHDAAAEYLKTADTEDQRLEQMLWDQLNASTDARAIGKREIDGGVVDELRNEIRAMRKEIAELRSRVIKD